MYPSCPHSSHATAVNAAVDAEVDCLLLFLLRKEGEYVGDWYLHTEKKYIGLPSLIKSVALCNWRVL